MIQLIAASSTNRELAYFTFGNIQFSEELNEMVSILRNNKVTVGMFDIYECLFYNKNFT